MLLKVRVSNIASLLALSEHLRKLTGVEQTETTIVLKSQFERSVSLIESSARRFSANENVTD